MFGVKFRSISFIIVSIIILGLIAVGCSDNLNQSALNTSRGQLSFRVHFPSDFQIQLIKSETRVIYAAVYGDQTAITRPILSPGITPDSPNATLSLNPGDFTILVAAYDKDKQILTAGKSKATIEPGRITKAEVELLSRFDKELSQSERDLLNRIDIVIPQENKEAKSKPDKKVTICHNPDKDSQTLEVNASALDSHLAHGDKQGPCKEKEETTPTPTPSTSASSVPVEDSKPDASPSPSTPVDSPSPIATPEPAKADSEPIVMVRPANNASQSLGSTMTFEAQVNDESIKIVEFMAGSKVLSTISQPPYTYSWDTTSESVGEHSLKAVGRDANEVKLHESPVVKVNLFTATSDSVVNNTPVPDATQPPTPVVTSFSPSSGSVGTIVTITGSNFIVDTLATSVKFGGVQGTITSRTNTQIVTTVPSGATTSSISVIVGNTQGSSDGLFNVLTVAPTILSFTPPTGNSQTNVTILGNNFSSTPTDNTVTLAGIPAQVVQATETTLVVKIAPEQIPNFSGAVTNVVSVSTSLGSTNSAGNFTWDAEVSAIAGQANTQGVTDGIGTAARFRFPTDTIVTPTGIIYVGDQNNHCVRKITADGNVATLAGLCNNSGNSTGTGNTARFNQAFRLALDDTGNIYLSDRTNHCIRKITPVGVVTTFAGICGNPGSFNDATTPTNSTLNQPSGITFDRFGNLFIAEDGNDGIRKIDGTTGETTNYVSNGTFNNPDGIVFDSAGNLFVADQLNHKIRKVTPIGVVSDFVGNGTASSVDGVGTGATINQPDDLDIDAQDNIYVAEITGRKIRKITPAGVTSTIAGTGVQSNINGPAASATFDNPAGITLDPNSLSLYVADFQGHQIRKIVR